MISIVKVDVSDNLKNADFYFSVYNIVDQKVLNSIIKTVKDKTSYIRFKMVKALKAKYVPEIKFIYSDEYEYVDKINQMIGKTRNGLSYPHL